jgi:hypothetical protein
VHGARFTVQGYERQCLKCAKVLKVPKVEKTVHGARLTAHGKKMKDGSWCTAYCKNAGNNTASSNRNLNLICTAAMGCGDHGHDPGRWVDFVEKTPGADTIPPYVRVLPFQPFDIGTS